MTSRDFALLSLRLLSWAQDWILQSSEYLDASLLAGTIRFVSSAYLQRKLPGVIALRSPTLATYAVGPIADPCIILALGRCCFIILQIWELYMSDIVREGTWASWLESIALSQSETTFARSVPRSRNSNTFLGKMTRLSTWIYVTRFEWHLICVDTVDYITVNSRRSGQTGAGGSHPPPSRSRSLLEIASHQDGSCNQLTLCKGYNHSLQAWRYHHLRESGYCCSFGQRQLLNSVPPPRGHLDCLLWLC